MKAYSVKSNRSNYVKDIAPLVEKIMAACKRHAIPMIASFNLSSSETSTSIFMPKGSQKTISSLVKPRAKWVRKAAV